jgi:molecular chaperone GrpE
VKKKHAPAVERAKAMWARFVNLKLEPHMTDQETPQPGAEKAQTGEELVETPESIAAERDQLLTEKSDLQDALLRRAAEFDNFRKRTERERSDLCEYAAADAVSAMLPVLDDLDRALKMQTADDDFVKGVELIYQRMVEVLAKLGLQPIEAVGQPFDPNFHHAIEMVQTDEHEDQTVLAELLRGYTFKGRLLRASMVKVAVNG